MSLPRLRIMAVLSGVFMQQCFCVSASAAFLASASSAGAAGAHDSIPHADQSHRCSDIIEPGPVLANDYTESYEVKHPLDELSRLLMENEIPFSLALDQWKTAKEESGQKATPKFPGSIEELRKDYKTGFRQATIWAADELLKLHVAPETIGLKRYLRQRVMEGKIRRNYGSISTLVKDLRSHSGQERGCKFRYGVAMIVALFRVQQILRRGRYIFDGNMRHIFLAEADELESELERGDWLSLYFSLTDFSDAEERNLIRVLQRAVNFIDADESETKVEELQIQTQHLRALLSEAEQQRADLESKNARARELLSSAEDMFADREKRVEEVLAKLPPNLHQLAAEVQEAQAENTRLRGLLSSAEQMLADIDKRVEEGVRKFLPNADETRVSRQELEEEKTRIRNLEQQKRLSDELVSALQTAQTRLQTAQRRLQTARKREHDHRIALQYRLGNEKSEADSQIRALARAQTKLQEAQTREQNEKIASQRRLMREKLRSDRQIRELEKAHMTEQSERIAMQGRLGNIQSQSDKQTEELQTLQTKSETEQDERVAMEGRLGNIESQLEKQSKELQTLQTMSKTEQEARVVVERRLDALEVAKNSKGTQTDRKCFFSVLDVEWAYFMWRVFKIASTVEIKI